MARRASLPLWLLVVLALVLSGCKAGAGDACKQTGDCQDGLLCLESKCHTQPQGDLWCRQGDRADGCSSLGRCTASKEGECIAGKNEDCLRSGICDKLGFCAAINGRCALSAEKDADCRGRHGSIQHDHCGFAGLCSARNGECVAATDEDCKGAVVCQQDGRCTAQDDRCTLGATTRAHCNRQIGMLKRNPCRDEGRCTPSKGGCIAGQDADCAPTEGCKRRGLCSAKAGSCRAEKDEDCKQSEACKALDLCVRQPEGTCAAKACSESRACTELGHCELVVGRCQATSQAHCRKSKGCAEAGYCQYDGNFGRCLQKPLGEASPVPSDEGPIVIVSRTAILIGDEGEPVVRLPSREEQIRTGIATSSKGGKEGALLIAPLAKRVQAAVQLIRKQHLAKWRGPLGGPAVEAIVIADEETPYRILIEVVYTLGQSGIGRYHLMAMKRAEPTTGDAGAPAPPTPLPSASPSASPAQPALTAIQGPKNLNLVAHLGAAGITLRTSGGAVASGCTALGPSVTVPKAGDAHDWDALASCLLRVKAAFPTETTALLSATNDMPYRHVLRLMDELRGQGGKTLFPDTNLGVPRTTKETP